MNVSPTTLSNNPWKCYATASALTGVVLVILGIVAGTGALGTGAGSYWYCFELGAAGCFVSACVGSCKQNTQSPAVEKPREEPPEPAFVVSEADKKLPAEMLCSRGANAYRHKRFKEAWAYFEAAGDHGPALIFKAEMLGPQDSQQIADLYEQAGESHNNLEGLCFWAILERFNNNFDERVKKVVAHPSSMSTKVVWSALTSFPAPSEKERIEKIKTALETDLHLEASRRRLL